ncbi:MAG: TetR/AcrR family transcriptional regulator [Bacteroidota bacterium]
MNRKDHEQAIRKKILITANKLFLEKGYHKTTVRQIIQHADIRNGTLYHYYKDKEDIYKNIVIKIFDRVIERTEQLIPNHLATPELYITAEFIWHFEAMLLGKNTAELYYIAYSASSISSEILQKRSERHSTLFAETAPHLSMEEHRVRSLMCKGYLQASALEAMNDALSDTEDFLDRSIGLLLALYLQDQQRIKKAIQDARSLRIGDYVSKTEAREVIQ